VSTRLTRVDGFRTIARVSDFREGKIRRFFVDGKEIAVVLWNERFYAFHNRCTHADFQMHFGFVEDDCLHCPIHYGVYDLASGKAISGPVTDLPTYPVLVEGDEVQISPEPVAAS
jgi:nitrite reductase/ring-hydroxylating ferredoxin subunit